MGMQEKRGIPHRQQTIILKKSQSPEDAGSLPMKSCTCCSGTRDIPYIVANPQTDDDSPRLFHDLALALQEPVYEPLSNRE